MWADYVKAFLVGGALCAAGQVLVDQTKLTPARILSVYVVTGVFLSGTGVYERVSDWAGCGASVPLTGFGHLLASGVKKAVTEDGVLGALTGGLTASAAGICSAIFAALVVAALCKPREKK